MVEPSTTEGTAIKRALLGYAAYGSASGAVVLLGLFVLLREYAPGYPTLAPGLMVVGGVLLVAAAHVDTVVFRDYGIHFYEYDVGGLVTDSMSRKDLGIRPQDFLIGFVGVVLILLLGVGSYSGLTHLTPLLPRGSEEAAGAFLVMIALGGLVTFAVQQRGVTEERHEFFSLLPARALLLPGHRHRPHLAVQPKTGDGGYPDPREPRSPTPKLKTPRNVLLILADGLRADHVCGSDGLTPALADFAARPEVIASRQHLATGPFTEIGLHGLTYGLHGHAYFPFLTSAIPSWPLHVFQQNDYEVALITGSRLLQFPSPQLLENFSHVVTVDRDEKVFRATEDFLAQRRSDGRPYVLVVFYYAPHWPFDEVEERNRLFRPDLADKGRSAFQNVQDESFRQRVRNSYRNAVKQADLNFSRTFELVRDDYENGQTLVAFTSDHGTELWEHGVMGQGCSSFWKEKIAVPFMMGLPGRELEPGIKSPELSSHVDFLPTLLDYLGTDPAIPPPAYSHGRSLLTPMDAAYEPVVTVSGRFFPWADRQNALVTAHRKYWFHVARNGRGADDFVMVTGRTTDLQDRPSPQDAGHMPEKAAARFKDEFWRFLEPVKR